MLGDEREHLACGKQLKFTPLPTRGPPGFYRTARQSCDYV